MSKKLPDSLLLLTRNLSLLFRRVGFFEVANPGDASAGLTDLELRRKRAVMSPAQSHSLYSQ